MKNSTKPMPKPEGLLTSSYYYRLDPNYHSEDTPDNWKEKEKKECQKK